VADLDAQLLEQSLVGVGGEDGAIVRHDALRPAVCGQRGGEELEHGDRVLICGGHPGQDLARIALENAERIRPVIVVIEAH